MLESTVLTSCSYWTMQFDASPSTLRGLNTLMRHDPRVIRWTALKVGEKVDDVLAVEQKTIARDYYAPKQ